MLSNMYSKLSGSSRGAFIAAIGGISAIMCYGWFVSPHLACVEASLGYAHKIGAYADRIKSLESTLQLEEIEIGRLSKQVAATQRQLFTVAEAQHFFAGLEQVATQAQCTITSLHPIADEPDTAQKTHCDTADVTAYRISAELVGNYADIVNFLSRLLDRPNKIAINPFSLSICRRDPEKLECTLVLTLHIVNDTNSKGTDPNE